MERKKIWGDFVVRSSVEFSISMLLSVMRLIRSVSLSGRIWEEGGEGGFSNEKFSQGCSV